MSAELSRVVKKIESARSLLDSAAEDLMAFNPEKGHDVKQLVFAADLQLASISVPGTPAPHYRRVD